MGASGVVSVADYLGYAIRQDQLALLNVSVSGTNVILSWSSSLTGFVPESGTNVIGGPWTPIPTNAIVFSGQTYYLTNQLVPGSLFYRLHQTIP